jgi:hypothetical protein
MAKTLKLLLVEDNDDDALLLLTQLQYNGYEVSHRRVETREQMVDALRGESWDIIISDYRLPNFSGEDALTVMKESGVDLPFIILSGTIGEEAAISALKRGANDFVIKGKFARLFPAIDREIKEAEGRRQRQRTQEQLENSQHLVARISDAMPDHLYLADLIEDRLVYANERFKSFFGFDDDEIARIGRTRMIETVHPDDRQRIDEQRGNFSEIDESQVIECEYRAQNARGKWRWLATREVVFTRKTDGTPKVILGMSVDINDRKQAELALRESESKGNAILNAAPDGVIVCGLDGTITFWSEGARRIYGWSSDETVGKSLSDIIRAEGEGESRILFEATMNAGAWKGELTQLTKDGKEIFVQATHTLMRDDEGKPNAILIVNTDITEMKNLEKQFLRAQRMESIGTLAGGIAHDLNNVLAPIVMSLDILRRKYPDKENERILETLQGSARRGVDMVKQVLTFARGVQGERVLLQPQYLIEEMVKISRDTFPKSIELQKDIPKDLWKISGDPTQLHQVLLNLCINARDAMPNGGTLKLQAKNILFDESYTRLHIDAKVGPYVCIEVIDSGEGIPQAIIDKIFDPFFTTKEIGKGTGLGLSTTLAIVKNHGGFVTVYSEVGRGTTFKVYLPVVTDASTVAQPENTMDLPMGNGETVLVVDDESAIREMTRTMLETCGYNVASASDGTEGLALFVQQMDKIDVVLTDMMMPYMDGSSMVRAMRRLQPKLRVIATSGLGSREDDQKLSDLNIQAFMTKPYTAEKLLTVLHEVLSGNGKNGGHSAN